MPYPSVLFLHVGWARAYQGDRDDLPTGTFRHLAEGNLDIGEACNFKSYRGRCYGYSPCGSAIDIERLGARPGASSISNVLVVWTATAPKRGGRYIIGWWHKAKVYRHIQMIRPQPRRPECVAVAKAGDCHLLADEDRTFRIPAMVKGWPGKSSSFFASDVLSKRELNAIIGYVDGSAGIDDQSPRPVRRVKRAAKPTEKPGWPLLDPLLRAKIEKKAIRCVWKHYESRKWDVTSVEKENEGWDLEARANGRVLRIEVKGRGGDGSVQITPNEYGVMRRESLRSSYRLAIVHWSLSAEPVLTIFRHAAATDAWVDQSGWTLRLKPMTGAVGSF